MVTVFQQFCIQQILTYNYKLYNYSSIILYSPLIKLCDLISPLAFPWMQQQALSLQHQNKNL